MLPARCTGQLLENWYAIEGLLGRIHQAVVVGQDPLGADEEIVFAGDLQVEDMLDLVGPHRLHGEGSLDRS